MLLIGAAALLVFGPKRLPELAKSVGKGIRDFKKAVSGEDEKEALPNEKKTADTLEHDNKEKVKNGERHS